MTSLSRNARIAGLLYLTLLTAPLRLVYIPTKLFVAGNASATANNIAAHETLFRLGIASDLFVGTIVIFVALALYRLFKQVDRNLARLMVILGGLLPAAIYFCNVLNDAAALTLAHGASFLSAFEKPQRDALVMLFLHLHGQGFNRTFFSIITFFSAGLARSSASGTCLGSRSNARRSATRFFPLWSCGSGYGSRVTSAIEYNDLSGAE